DDAMPADSGAHLCAEASAGVEGCAGGLVLDEFDADHQTFLSDVADVGKGFEVFEQLRKFAGPGLDLCEQVVLLEQGQGGEGCGAGEGVAGVGMAVEEGAVFPCFAKKGVKEALSCESCGQGEVAPGNALGDAE